jgi:hypothetical protein
VQDLYSYFHGNFTKYYTIIKKCYNHLKATKIMFRGNKIMFKNENVNNLV